MKWSSTQPKWEDKAGHGRSPAGLKWGLAIVFVGVLVVGGVYASSMSAALQPQASNDRPSTTALQTTAISRQPAPPKAGALSPTHSLTFASKPTSASPGRGPTGWIVFTCTPERYSQMCMMDASGGHWTRLTRREADDSFPALSPNGKWVVFSSNRSGQEAIYLRGLVSGQERLLTGDGGLNSEPVISPDGEWVVFTRRLSGAGASIWKVQLTGSLPRQLTGPDWSASAPAWSPDGAQIAFAAGQGGFMELFVMEADGGAIRQITHDLPGIGGRSSWSPDGRYLAFYAGRRGDRDIYLWEIATGQLRRLTFGGNNADPSFSPDGEWLAFSSSRDGDHEIFIMRQDGSDVTQLTDNQTDDWQPNWGFLESAE